jgi:hypothetical protein
VSVGTPEEPVVVECHFAADRWAGKLPIAATAMEEA